MAQLKSIKRWFWWHRWTSLICTLFLLLLCITGLPLVFGEEIDEWLNTEAPYEILPKNTPQVNLNHLVQQARAKYPTQVISSIFIDDELPQAVVGLQPTFQSGDESIHGMQFDARTGKLRNDFPTIAEQPQTFTGLMLSLHRDLFMGLPGELFMGFMGLLFVISIISGVVLYGPFMKKLDFGAIRSARSRRVKWLDLHNLLGIATTVWLFVVGFTGVMNELSTPLFGIWQITDVQAMLNKYQGRAVPKQRDQTSVEAAFQTAKQAVPGMTVTSVVFPGDPFGTPYHYLMWAKGNTPFTSQLFSPVLVDARTGKLAAVLEMPVYLRALEVSRPLHFGDYGGMPLKVIWAVFDVLAIVVLVSGVYLWFARHSFYKDQFNTLEATYGS